MAKLKVLVVEDDPDVAQLHCLQLSRYGIEPCWAPNPVMALEVVRSLERLDAILMDIELGTRIDGIDLAREILQIRACPLFFLTSHDEDEFVRRANQVASLWLLQDRY